jgi:hypothetical protein
MIEPAIAGLRKRLGLVRRLLPCRPAFSKATRTHNRRLNLQVPANFFLIK